MHDFLLVGDTTASATTDDVRLEERLEYWEYWNQRSLVGLRCSSPTPERFYAESRQRSLTGSVITRIRGSQHVVDRSTQSIAAVPKDSVFVNVLLKGTAFLYDAGGLRPLRAGDSFVHTTASPYLLGFERDMDLLVIDVEAELAPDRWRARAGMAPEIRASNLASQRLASECLALLGDATLSGAAETKVAESYLTIMRGGEGPEAAFEHAMSLIRSHLCDSSFGAASLAQAVHLSERQLRRLFATFDLSPGAVILEERLQRSHALLQSDACETVNDVAAACGFGSASAFARAFRTRFDASPSEVRANARTSLER